MVHSWFVLSQMLFIFELVYSDCIFVEYYEIGVKDAQLILFLVLKIRSVSRICNTVHVILFLFEVMLAYGLGTSTYHNVG